MNFISKKMIDAIKKNSKNRSKSETSMIKTRKGSANIKTYNAAACLYPKHRKLFLMSN